MSSTGITLDSVVMNLDSAGSMTATRISTGRHRAVDPALVNDNNNNNKDNDGGGGGSDGNGKTAVTIGPRIMVDGGGGRSSVRVFADCR